MCRPGISSPGHRVDDPVLLLITQIGQLAPTLLMVGVITYLLVYAVAMIRDIDNPFEYPNGRAGAADVDLGVLESCETRLHGLAAAMGSQSITTKTR
jgi:hypothetical protein